MTEVNVRDAGVRPDLWTEAAVMAVASRAMSNSSLVPMVDRWLSQASLPDSKSLLSLAVLPRSASRKYWS